MPVSQNKQFARRLSVAVALPIILSALLFTWLLTNHAHDQLKDQGYLMGQAIADQLAISLADHLVNDDLLSLHVVLSELTVRGNFDFASVYSSDNRLLAQTGQRRENRDQVIFTRDITFQNVTVGYVQIGFEQANLYSSPARLLVISVVLYIGVAGLFLLLIARWPSKIRAWLVGDVATSVDAVSGQESFPADAEINTQASEIKTVCVLVLRIRPARLAGNYRDSFARALSLYGGVITNTEANDISAVFSARDQAFHAICGGLLVKSMVRRIGPPLKLNGGIHSASTNDFSVAQKHASYLASISENWLLTSHRIYDEVGDNNTIIMQEFHSSLTPDGEVYSVNSLTDTNQVLIDKQADRLI
ncbi:MAG: hypothetical protein WD356_02615 [Pseudomonadales bacterium]